MRSKEQCSFKLKLLLVCLFFAFLLFLILRSDFSPSNLGSSSSSQIFARSSSNSSNSQAAPDQSTDKSTSSSECPPVPLAPTCTKIPPSLAHAIVHYAATNVTPQQTLQEISVSLRVLEKKSPFNFLVFGLGRDSLMWTALNHGGRTVFLEEDKLWIQLIKREMPGLEAYHVVYDTKLTDADRLFDTASQSEECKTVADPRISKCPLAHKGFPNDVYDVEWDLIMVDAPTGHQDAAPGRMTAIYTAGLMARNRESGETDVFLHDSDRPVEDKFSRGFLCEGYLNEQEGRLRHFIIPSHRTRMGRPFCP